MRNGPNVFLFSDALLSPHCWKMKVDVVVYHVAVSFCVSVTNISCDESQRKWNKLQKNKLTSESTKFKMPTTANQQQTTKKYN